jgi:hypothetical protein
VKQIHLLPGLVEVHSNEPSSNEVEDHKNLTNYFKQVPEAGRLAYYGEEKESCKEVVGLNQEEKVRPQLSER